jgi:hypothetical protein
MVNWPSRGPRVQLDAYDLLWFGRNTVNMDALFLEGANK